MNELRAKVNEYELAFKNVKNNLKYEIELENEGRILDDMENEDATNLDISGLDGKSLIKNDIGKSEWGLNKSKLSKDKLTKTSKSTMDEDPLGINKMTNEEYRKFREQILTDQWCAIPSSLQINEDL